MTAARATVLKVAFTTKKAAPLKPLRFRTRFRTPRQWDDIWQRYDRMLERRLQALEEIEAELGLLDAELARCSAGVEDTSLGAEGVVKGN